MELSGFLHPKVEGRLPTSAAPWAGIYHENLRGSPRSVSGEEGFGRVVLLNVVDGMIYADAWRRICSGGEEERDDRWQECHGRPPPHLGMGTRGSSRSMELLSLGSLKGSMKAEKTLGAKLRRRWPGSSLDLVLINTGRGSSSR